VLLLLLLLSSLAGLPDGLFLNQKSRFVYILEGFKMENVEIFYGQLEYLRTLVKFCDRLVHFVLIWYILLPVLISCTKKYLAILSLAWRQKWKKAL
jgi:hypothetical protein